MSDSQMDIWKNVLSILNSDSLVRKRRDQTHWETWESKVPGASISGQDCDELLSLGRTFEFVLR